MSAPRSPTVAKPSGRRRTARPADVADGEVGRADPDHAVPDLHLDARERRAGRPRAAPGDEGQLRRAVVVADRAPAAARPVGEVAAQPVTGDDDVHAGEVDAVVERARAAPPASGRRAWRRRAVDERALRRTGRGRRRRGSSWPTAGRAPRRASPPRCPPAGRRRNGDAMRRRCRSQPTQPVRWCRRSDPDPSIVERGTAAPGARDAALGARRVRGRGPRRPGTAPGHACPTWSGICGPATRPVLGRCTSGAAAARPPALPARPGWAFPWPADGPPARARAKLAVPPPDARRGRAGSSVQRARNSFSSAVSGGTVEREVERHEPGLPVRRAGRGRTAS